MEKTERFNIRLDCWDSLRSCTAHVQATTRGRTLAVRVERAEKAAIAKAKRWQRMPNAEPLTCTPWTERNS